jgi:hypothetical protein
VAIGDQYEAAAGPLADPNQWIMGEPTSINAACASDRNACLYAFGGSTRFEHQPVVQIADWRALSSVSNGEARQMMYARYAPVAAGSETVWVDASPWQGLSDLTAAAADAKHAMMSRVDNRRIGTAANKPPRANLPGPDGRGHHERVKTPPITPWWFARPSPGPACPPPHAWRRQASGRRGRARRVFLNAEQEIGAHQHTGQRHLDPGIEIVVCIPSFRRPRQLRATLQSLADQRTGRRFAVVVVENDANAAAWAEYRFGAARGARIVVCVTLGTGIGGGLVIGGRLFRGSYGMAGEWGQWSRRNVLQWRSRNGIPWRSRTGEQFSGQRPRRPNPKIAIFAATCVRKQAHFSRVPRYSDMLCIGLFHAGAGGVGHQNPVQLDSHFVF